MATDGPEDESRDEATEHGVPISERTVKTEYTSFVELRCGITLQNDVETEQILSSSGDETVD